MAVIPPWKMPKARVMIIMGFHIIRRAVTPAAMLTVKQSMASAIAIRSISTMIVGLVAGERYYADYCLLVPFGFTL